MSPSGDLATLPFLARHGAATASTVALLGPPGTGKTHIAVALALLRERCRHGQNLPGDRSRLKVGVRGTGEGHSFG